MKAVAAKQSVEFFIEDSGNGRIRTELVRLQGEGFAIAECRDIECRDRQGNYIRRHLWKVPPGVRDNIVRLARRAGLPIVLYRRQGEDLPRDYLNLVLRTPDPFVELKKERAAMRRNGGLTPFRRIGKY